MKYGIKLWSINHDLYDEAVALCSTGEVDYIELLYYPGNEKDIEKLQKVEVILHGPTSLQGYSFGDGRIKRNRDVLHRMMELSNLLDSKYMILHPEFGSIDAFIQLLQSMDNPALNASGVVVENMPRYGVDDQKELIASTGKEIKKILDVSGIGFCLDLPHALKTAISSGRDIRDFLIPFFCLNPVIAHVSDGNMTNPVDEHLDLGTGRFDLSLLKSLVENSSVKYLTFEVPKRNGLKNDMKNVEKWKSLNFCG